MLPNCKSKNERLAIAVLSTIISMLLIVFAELRPQHFAEGQLIMKHICLLQIFASVLLFVGSIKCIRWFFLPWLLIALVFVYYLVYLSLSYWFHALNDLRSTLPIISFIYFISGFWCYYIYVVFVDFQEMRYTSSQEVFSYKYVKIEESI